MSSQSRIPDAHPPLPYQARVFIETAIVDLRARINALPRDRFYERRLREMARALAALTASLSRVEPVPTPEPRKGDHPRSPALL